MPLTCLLSDIVESLLKVAFLALIGSGQKLILQQFRFFYRVLFYLFIKIHQPVPQFHVFLKKYLWLSLGTCVPHFHEFMIDNTLWTCPKYSTYYLCCVWELYGQNSPFLFCPRFSLSYFPNTSIHLGKNWKHTFQSSQFPPFRFLCMLPLLELYIDTISFHPDYEIPELFIIDILVNVNPKSE